MHATIYVVEHTLYITIRCEKMEVGGLHVVEEILKGNLEGLQIPQIVMDSTCLWKYYRRIQNVA